MAIVIQQEPATRNWSGNPIHYKLYSAAAAGDASIYFEVKVKFKRTDASSYSDIVTLPYNPVNGLAKIDIQDILDGLLEYELPTIPVANEYTSPLFARKMTGMFYIAYREISQATPNPAFTDTVPGTPPIVIKGGLSFEKWRGDNYWANYFDVALPFLTWQQSGRLASLAERMYLAWYNHTNASAGELKMRRKVAYTDGTVASSDLNYPALAREVVFFPSGGNQLELASVFPSKKIHYWELQIWDINTSQPVSELYRYYLDNRHDRNEKTFNYRNSLGGLDSARVRGIIEDHAERKFTSQEMIVQHNYFEGHVILPRIRQADSTEIIISKADLGFFNKEEQDRIREIHFSRECWWMQQKKWLPINILTQSGKLRRNDEFLWTMPIEYSIGNTGDRYYTPMNVDLAEGSFTSPLLCTAVISELSVEFTGGQWVVSWSLISGSPVRYHISTPGVSGGAVTQVTDTSYAYDWLPEGDNVITVRPVCQIGEEFHSGAAQTVTIENGTVCTPVGFATDPSMPDATKDAPYNLVVELSGSEPFTLSDVVKPAWMTIEVSANTIVFSGTATVASAGATVSYAVKNCSDAHLIGFGDTIAVVEPGAGLIYIDNVLPGAQITNIDPEFFTLVSGGYPIYSGFSDNGTHSGFSGTLDVSVSASSSGRLLLYINSSIIYNVTFTVGGTYSFPLTGLTIGATDTVNIILTTL